MAAIVSKNRRVLAALGTSAAFLSLAAPVLAQDWHGRDRGEHRASSDGNPGAPGNARSWGGAPSERGQGGNDRAAQDDWRSRGSGRTPQGASPPAPSGGTAPTLPVRNPSYVDPRRDGSYGATAAGQAAALIVAGTDPDDARLDACRADALAARLLAAPLGDTDDATDSRLWSRDTGAGIEVQLVIDLQTLRGECDNPCLLDGAPLPAQLGRDLAGYAKAFRRMVTDPVDGHLLDYGTRTYLPQPLRTYVLARDGGCRAPGCGVRHPSRVQLDHAVEFPHGPSTPGNTGSLCTTCHQLKTDRRIDLTDSRADGSATWVTAWGQTVWIPPRSYLPDVEPAPPPLEAPPF